MPRSPSTSKANPTAPFNLPPRLHRIACYQIHQRSNPPQRRRGSAAVKRADCIMSSVRRRAMPSTEGLDPSEDVFMLQKTIVSAELFNPVLVTINVVDEGETKSFNVPRALITARSEYFEKAFRGPFKEAVKKEITLKDDKIATHWSFAIFVQWLYTGRVYLDESASMQVACEGTQKRKWSDDGDDEAKVKRIKEISRATETNLVIAPVEGQGDDDEDDEAEQGSDIVIDRGSDVSFEDYSPAGSAKDTSEEPEEEEASRPITWVWRDLFDLFIFTDKYDCPALRHQMLVYIQLKLFMCRPREYLGPGPRDTQYAIENIPTSSPLYRLLVDFWAHYYIKDAGQDCLSGFPSSFLADCLLELSRFDDASSRPRGYRRYSHGNDGTRPVFRFPCYYHDHRNDDEATKQRCDAQWAYLISTYCE
ncbi:hypothetical protein HII31_09684 [Pseudocercospora fuligena]|uniref:BTB domain-containing protein n=1 Tax=Pseudocercospora fuligena TaxID=685502 RepID=A0A8H6RCC8_9PEZI|nr:hypothetical protein HII31_09684 [Pseudocercospora fuligena]